MLLTVIGIVLLIFCSIGLVVFIKSRRDEVEEYYSAAANIVKEENLKNSLLNSDADASHSSYERPMLYVKTKHNGKQKYVFDPKKGIYIGRDKPNVQICINEAFVSQMHCRIFSYGKNVYLQDMNSCNGVNVKRGMQWKSVPRNSSVMLLSGDKLRIGTVEMKIVLFTYNEVFM